MDWRTEIAILPSNTPITHNDFVLLMGSCFSVNIEEKLRKYGFGSTCNPTGIMYNIHSIVRTLEMLLGQRELDESRFVERDGMVCHYDFHWNFRAKSRAEFVKNLGQAQKVFQEEWERVTHVFVTLGTAHVHKYDGEIVANCHKVPSAAFDQQVQSVAEIQKDLHQISLLAEAKSVIATVSPVRHVRLGLSENARSKALLLTAVHASSLSYFPSYEIMMDDLRDYRFYERDRIHPSEEAVDYIWKMVGQVYFSEETHGLVHQVDKLRKMQEHRAFNEESEAHKAFLRKREELDQKLRKELPYLR